MEAERIAKRNHRAFMDGQLAGALLAGKKPKEVYLSLRIPLRTIYRKWKRIREEGALRPRLRSGRPKVTTPREDRHIIREVERDPFTSCKKIATNIGRPDLSADTIERRLAKARWVQIVPCREEALVKRGEPCQAFTMGPGTS
jgi:hypothetical protein